MTAPIFDFDAYSSAQIAEKVEVIGVRKARLPLTASALLGVIAGAFIGMGALYYTLVASDATLSFAVTRVLGGLVFSFGLILVVLAGAELFTGNNLLVMAWADGKISTFEVLRNWVVIYLANAVGAVGLAFLVYLADHGTMNGGAVAQTYVRIGAAKAALPFAEAFFKGILCNALVCLAVWLTFAGRSVTDKILATIFPISAFVAAGFEHCIANMYFFGLAALWQGEAAHLSGWGIAHNLFAVTLGNAIGGSVLVAAIYHLIYRRAIPRE
jgi:formate transporter